VSEYARQKGTAMPNKVITRINKSIITALEKGTVPWRSPYVPHQSSNGHRYRGFNSWILNHQAKEKGYTSPVWWTAQACFKQGGNLAGQKATTIRYFALKKKKNNPDETYMMARLYWVFNSDQITWPEDHQDPPPIDFTADGKELVKEYLNEQGIELTKQPGMAYYSVTKDTINVPVPESLTSVDEYYPLLYHEMGHSTGTKDRLNREGITDRNGFGDHSYSHEELVAEFTCAYLCGYTNLGMDHLEQSAAYISGWLEKIKEDPNILDKATREAEKAFQFITKEEGEDTNEQQ